MALLNNTATPPLNVGAGVPLLSQHKKKKHVRWPSLSERNGNSLPIYPTRPRIARPELRS